MQSANIMQASSDSDLLPAKHVNFNLTVAGFVPYQEPWILYLSIHIKRVEIELKTHSTILLQNLFAGSNYPWGRYYLWKINAKQISFPNSLAKGLKIHL